MIAIPSRSVTVAEPHTRGKPSPGLPAQDVECECGAVQTIVPGLTTFTVCSACGKVFRLVDGQWEDAEPKPEHQAKSSGALGTPDRDSTCEECGGAGKVLRWFGLACSERCCPVCAGKGGLSPATARRALSGDRADRERLSKVGSAGRTGRKS